MILAGYEKKILKLFSKAYPESTQYKQNGRPLRKANWEKIFPEIIKDVEKKNAFLDSVESLNQKGVISVKWKRFREGDTITALYLEKPSLLYQLLNEKSPEILRVELLEFLSSYAAREKTEKAIASYLKNEIEQKKMLPKKKEIMDILKLAALNPKDAVNTTIRSLSVRLYGNSKHLESIIKNCDRIAELAKEEKLSVSLNLERSFPETTITGELNLNFYGGTLWSLENRIITLPYSTCLNIESISSKEGYKLLIIENKETFYVYQKSCSKFSAYLYLAGQPNRSDLKILSLLKKSGLKLFYFSDLDPAGLLIFKQVYDFLDGQITPYLMDEEVYNKWLPYAYEVSENELKKLGKISLPLLEKLQNSILDKGKGIEQEIIELE